MRVGPSISKAKTGLVHALFAALCAGVSAFGASPALADDALQGRLAMVQQTESNPFSALVGERRERGVSRQQARIERYVLASDNRALLIESQSRTARVKFLCGPGDERIDCTLDPAAPAAEVYLLTVTRGPRGDLIYKNADGHTYVRLASYGGATVHWPGDEGGSAASKSFGDDRPIMLEAAGFEVVRRRATTATAMISALAGSPIVFDVPDAQGEATVLADAVVRAAKGLSSVAGDPTGARILGERIDRVTFAPATNPAVRFDGAALIVEYAPEGGLAGRLSSRAIERFLEDSL